VTDVLPENEESERAWNGVLFDRFVQYKHLVLALATHGEAAIEAYPPRPGDSVLDVGCGVGDSTRRLAELVGPEGTALGVDISARFVEAARADAEGIANVRFEAHDVQGSRFDERFDYVFSRFGTMFFASPVAALRNMREAMATGGRLVLVVWRRREDNPWVHVAEAALKPLVPPPEEETDEARCGPGPFSMANPDTVSQQLLLAGFEAIRFDRVDLPFLIGRDLDEAVEFNLALGPAAEAIRLAGPAGEAMRPELGELLRKELVPFDGPDGVVAPSSTWVVSARAA
jgi:SAM-dependent methyltransferase